MSTPTNAAEIIRESLEYIRDHSRSTSPELISKYAEDALSILADIDGGGEVVKPIMRRMLPQHVDGRWDETADPEYEYVGQKRPLIEGWSWQPVHIVPATRPSPTSADAPPDPDAHIADQEQYLKAKKERAKDLEFDDSRTPVDPWISVKDRLPDDRSMVLAFVLYPSGDYVQSVSFYHAGFWSAIQARYVTHWMPIPEPPQP